MEQNYDLDALTELDKITLQNKLQLDNKLRDFTNKTSAYYENYEDVVKNPSEDRKTQE